MIVGAMVGVWAVVLAASAGTDLGPYAQIANYGILGLIALALFQGRVVPAKQYEQVLADRDREHGELISLRVKTEEQFIPAIIRNTEMLARLVEKTT